MRVAPGVIGLALAIACSFAGGEPGGAAGETATIIALGDLALCDRAERAILREGPEYPWRQVKHVLDRGDLRIGNLETPLCRPGPIHYPWKLIHLRSSPEILPALRAGGLDLLSLANNHLLDYGPAAMDGTIRLLDQAGIAHAGAGRDAAEARRAVVLEMHGARLAFLSYCSMPPAAYGAAAGRPGTAFCLEEDILQDIRAAKTRADHVIVAMHWGRDFVSVTPTRNRRLGRACIDAGATLVLGHHPHVLQGIEIYRGGLIAYSLGNFVFGHGSGPNRSAILEIMLAGNGVAAVRVHPVRLHGRDAPYQPYVASGDEAREILQALQRLSAPFGTGMTIDDGTGRIDVHG